MENSKNLLPKRKKIRLEGFDYSSSGSYFVTICIKDENTSLWSQVGADIIRPNYEFIEDIKFPLSEVGEIVETAILNIPKHYDGITVDKYVIMPDHIHMILSIYSKDGRMISAPTLSTVVGQMKRWVSKQTGKSIWQKSFFDSIIDSDAVYNDVWEYINNNPRKMHKGFKY